MGGLSHLDGLDIAGISMQLISPRPNQMIHSQKPGEIVIWYTQASNDLVARYIAIWPDRFVGIASIPQISGEPLVHAVTELERCINKLKFKGFILNPDPYENSGTEPPPLWDKYWYPIYETASNLGVPCYLHATGRPSNREYFNHYYIHEESVAVLAFICSDVLENFPDLKIIAPHGGGSVPYQIGRYLAGERAGKQRDFISRMKKIYFDSVLHNLASVEYLLKTIGVDNCIYGTEWPGLGSVTDTDNGKTMDNLAQGIKEFDWLSKNELEKFFSRNAIELFKLGPVERNC
ncbi:MAG: amidohydrolase [Gammaproteobacteria bacterium]|nr:amidohydrolase [Gammaproteobacteria bacterium]